MITLRELGAGGLARVLLEQDRKEISQAFGGMPTDLPGFIPSPLGRGGAIPRKTDAAQRLMISQERHAKLILAEVWRLYDTEHGRDKVGRQVKTSRNVLNRVVDELAVAYETPPVRRFGKGGSLAMERAWRDVVIDAVTGAGFDLLAGLWARYAFFLNVVHVIPSVIDGRLAYTTVLPHAADVVIADGDTEPSILTYLTTGAGFVRVAVDNERYWHLDQAGQIVNEFEHRYRDIEGEPMQPWVQWRTRGRLDSLDYWDRGRGRQIIDTTLEVGVVDAAMRAVRQANNSKLSTLQADNVKDNIPPGQQVSPEIPMVGRDFEFEVHDLIVPVKEFLEHMNSAMEEIAEAHGVHRGVIDKSASTDAFSDHVAVARQRNKQLPFLRKADIATQVKTAIIMKAEGHRASPRLPPRRVARSVVLDYPELTFAQRPKERLEVQQLRLSMGLTDPVQVYMAEHPGTDAEEARRQLDKSAELRNELIHLQTVRNMPADAARDSETLAQQQGRQGGQTSHNTSHQDRDDERRQQQ